MSPSFGATFENIFYGFPSKCSRSFFINAKEKMTAFEKNFSNLPLCHVAYRLLLAVSDFVHCYTVKDTGERFLNCSKCILTENKRSKSFLLSKLSNFYTLRAIFGGLLSSNLLNLDKILCFHNSKEIFPACSFQH